MRAIIFGVGLLLAGAAAHAQQPASWTIMASACSGEKDCAIGLFGQYQTRDQCIAANQGKLQVVATLPDGRRYTKRCELVTDGPAIVRDVPATPESPPGSPKWTIFRSLCVPMSPTSGQCAVGLVGKFSTSAQCVTANQGREEFEMSFPDGRKYSQYCQALLEKAY